MTVVRTVVSFVTVVFAFLPSLCKTSGFDNFLLTFRDLFAHGLALSKNPGRVVTLVHKEDWDKFSASVRIVFTAYPFSPFSASNRMHFPTMTSYGASTSVFI